MVACSRPACGQDVFKEAKCLTHYREAQDAKGSKGKASGKRKIVSKNRSTIDELLVSVKQNKKFVKMVSYTCDCLVGMVVDDVSAEELVESGAIETLMDVLKENPNSEQIQRLVAGVLSKVCRNADLAKAVGQRMGGDYSLLVQSLSMCKEADTHLATINALNALAAGGQENLDNMKAQKLVPELGKVLEKHRDDVRIITSAAKLMTHLATDRVTALELTASGSAAIAIKGMQADVKNLELGRSGVELVARLANSVPDPEFDQARKQARRLLMEEEGLVWLDDDEDADEVNRVLKEAGAVDTIIAEVDTHPYDEQLLGAATKALQALTGEDDMERALRVLENANDKFQVNMQLITAMATVSSLALVPANAQTLFKGSGIDTILGVLKNALEAEPSDLQRKLLTDALRALARAEANGSQKDIYKILQGGGLTCILGALKQNPDNPEVVEAALSAMANLLSRPQNADFVFKKGGLQAAVAALKTHPLNEPVVRAALDVFAGFAQSDAGKGQLAEAGAIEALLDVLRNHQGNPVITGATLGLLGQLANSSKNVGTMVDGGLLQSLITAMNANIDHPEVLVTAVMLTETAALVPENAELLVGLGAMGAIATLVEAYPDHEDLRLVAGHAIETLNGYLHQLQAEQETLRRAELERAEKERQLEFARAEAEEMARVEAERAVFIAEQQRLAAEHAVWLEEQERLRVERAAHMAEQEGLIRARLEQAQRLHDAEAQRKRLETQLLAEMERMKAQEEYEMVQALERLRVEEEREARKEARRKKKAARIEAADAELQRIEMLTGQLGAQAKRGEEEGERMSRAGKVGVSVGEEEAEKATLSKSVRPLFESDTEGENDARERIELDPDVVEFLQAGALLTKHSKKADPKSRHVFLSSDNLFMCWKNPNQELEEDQKMSVFDMWGVTAGRATQQLQRKRAGRFLAAEDCCFSIAGSARVDHKKIHHEFRIEKGERSVDLECKTALDRKKWIAALDHLIEWASQEKLYGTKTVQMESNGLLALDSDDEAES